MSHKKGFVDLLEKGMDTQGRLCLMHLKLGVSIAPGVGTTRDIRSFRRWPRGMGR